MRLILACLACLLLAAGGCSGKRDPSELLGPTGAGTIVVDARLIVHERFPVILLSTTQSPDRPFDRDRAALVGASMMLTTTTGDTIWYQHYFEDRYLPIGATTSLQVLPSTTYHLHVTASDGRVVTASTTTPDVFQVREWLLVDGTTFEARRSLAEPAHPFPTVIDTVYDAEANQLIYQDGLVEARFDRGSALGFQMALANIEAGSPLLIDADFLSEEDKATLDRKSSSPALDAPDGYVRLPWLAVWFEGRHQFVVYSVDRNWYDLARSLRFYGPSGIGFGSNAGDDFERPIFHVQGGIGLFGSAAWDWTGFTVSPRP